MALQLQKIMAVIDPTTDKQLAFDRALNVAKRADASVHAYLCCYSAAETDHFLAMKRAELARHEAWLEKLVAAREHDGIRITTAVEWNEDWRTALGKAAANAACDLIVKAASEHSTPGRFLLKTSDFAVLRNSQAPVLLVKRDSAKGVRRILIAVNPKVEDTAHQRLNGDIISIGQQITEDRDDFELHAVCAYTGEDPFTHPQELSELVGIPENRAHCVSGTPDDVIVECAKQLDSELVVIGTVSRAGLQAMVKGNTAERALDRLDTDVLIVTLND